ncbi:MAG: primosomal protein N', partial [Aquabacterium commune]
MRLGVVVDAPQHSGLLGVLDYLSATALPPGTLVRVPLGRRVVTGVVWATLPPSGEAPGLATEDLKAVTEVLDGLPALP